MGLNELLELKGKGEDLNSYLCSMNNELLCVHEDGLGILDDSDAEEIFSMLGVDYIKDIEYLQDIYPVIEEDYILRTYAIIKNSGDSYKIGFNLIKDRFAENQNEGFWNFNLLKKLDSPDDFCNLKISDKCQLAAMMQYRPQKATKV